MTNAVGLLRTADWDWDSTRESLRVSARTGAGSATSGPWSAVAEPLSRRTVAGSVQSIRVEHASSRLPLEGYSVALEQTELIVEAEKGPRGTVRLLVPSVSEVQRVTVRTPDGYKLAVTVEPVPEWRVHLVPHTHLDIGFTDPQSTVLREHLDYLDSVLDIVSTTDDWPEESRFRWTIEGSHPLELWMSSRPPARREAMKSRLREGRIEMTALPYNLHTEMCSTEELHEHIDRCARLARDLGAPLTSAMQSDIPGATAGLPGALSAAGVRHLSVAHNWAGRAVPLLTGGDALPRMFRWIGPDGAVAVWHTDSAHGMSYVEGTVLGFTDQIDLVEDLLPTYLRALASNPFPFSTGIFGWHFSERTGAKQPYPWRVLPLRVQGFLGDNSPPRIELSEIVREWNDRWEYPSLRISTNTQALDAVAAHVVGDLNEYEGDWLNWWADGVGSGAQALGMAQRAQSSLQEAQAVTAMVTMLGGDRRDQSDRVYQPLGYFNEHTWGAAIPDSHEEAGRASGERMWTWKSATALAAYDNAESELQSALTYLAESVVAGDDALASVAVVNTTSLERTDRFEILVPFSALGSSARFSCRDARTSAAIPFNLSVPENSEHRNDGFLLRGVITVPPLSLVRIDLVPEHESLRSSLPPVADPYLLENEDFRVRVEPKSAAVSSIIHLASGLELVDPAHPAGMNAFIYDRYGSAGGVKDVALRLSASEALEMVATRVSGSPASLIQRVDDATGSSVTYRYPVPLMGEVETTVTLIRGSGRVDFRNRVIKSPRLEKEGGYFSFPFNLDRPNIEVSVTGGSSGTSRPRVPGSPSHLFVAEKSVSLSEDGIVILWTTGEAPLLQVGNIAQPYPPYHATLPGDHPAALYSWVFNNVWDTNFQASQSLDFTFTYSIGVDTLAASGEQFALTQAVRPFPSVVLRRGRTAAEPPERRFVTVDGYAVELVSMRRVGSADRIRLKLRSRSDKAGVVSVALPAGARDVQMEGLLGEQQTPLSLRDGGVSIPIRARSMVALSWSGEYARRTTRDVPHGE